MPCFAIELKSKWVEVEQKKEINQYRALPCFVFFSLPSASLGLRFFSSVSSVPFHSTPPPSPSFAAQAKERMPDAKPDISFAGRFTASAIAACFAEVAPSSPLPPGRIPLFSCRFCDSIRSRPPAGVHHPPGHGQGQAPAPDDCRRRG
jgi:hypothetical protein